MSRTAGTGLGIFVKTPELSEVKTRLADDIGRDAAHEVYERSLQVCEDVSRMAMDFAGGNLCCYWMVGEAEGVSHPRWKGLPCAHTGEGGLGSRLATVQHWLLERHRRAILLGSDCPQLSPELLADLAAREEAGVVVGPASDGGFYLFASEDPLERETWESVAYSRKDTLKQLLAAIGLRPAELLPEETDIDDLRSLRDVAARLADCSLDTQRMMAEWLARKGFS